MKRELFINYSEILNRDMHIMAYGHAGYPMIAFPCQDGMWDNWESFGMPELLSEYIESGQLQLFTVDTVDKESWSDKAGDKQIRAEMQERYFNYIIYEALPLIREKNNGDKLPIVTGFSLGAVHAAIVFLRRPDLFSGLLGHSGCYSGPHFWNGWCNETLYNNSPIDFLPNMPKDHPYIDIYNQKTIVLCVGQGAWEGGCIPATFRMKEIFSEKGINAWIDPWGSDVCHDWPWWKKQMMYHLPDFLNK